MEEMSEKTVILSFDEIRILLYSLGFESCEGIFMPRKEFSPQEILKAVYSMEKRGFLLLDENRPVEHPAGGGEAADGQPHFIILPRLKKMIQTMGKPGGSFEYRPGENLPGFSKDLYNGTEYYCYMLPDYCVVAERDWTRRESLRLRAMDMEAFTAWRQERDDEAREEIVAGKIIDDTYLVSEMKSDSEEEKGADGIREMPVGQEQDTGFQGKALEAIL